MSLDTPTHNIDLSLTESQTGDICSICVKSHIRTSFGAQNIYYTQNNHNEFNCIEA
jgi:hypothetical protein